ncbi:MAG TPA: DUF881 domain-containing protein [Acidimicrobiales bacterium]
MGRSPAERVLIALTVVAVGFLLGSQVRSGHQSPLEVASESDLTRILAGLTAEADALRGEIADLSADLARFEDANRAEEAATAAREAELDALAVLAGTVPVRGPGLRLVVGDPSGVLTSGDLLDAVAELRDAGAEALAVNGIRIVARSFFVDGPDGGVVLDGVVLSSPIELTAIGDPATLEGGLRIPGGVLDSLGAFEGTTVAVERADVLVLPAVSEIRPYRAARPVG